jgi:hypothetical protein
LTWHDAHGAVACRPRSGNVEWLNVPWFHDVSVALWQVSHVVGNPAAWWFGFVVAWYFAR